MSPSNPAERSVSAACSRPSLSAGSVIVVLSAMVLSQPAGVGGQHQRIMSYSQLSVRGRY